MGKSIIGGNVDPHIKMTGKTVLVTGANAGLGLESSIDLARRGARVVMACRNMDKGKNAKQRVRNKYICDLYCLTDQIWLSYLNIGLIRRVITRLMIAMV